MRLNGADGFKIHNNCIEDAGQFDIFLHLAGLNNVFYNNYTKIWLANELYPHFLRHYENWDTGPKTIKQQAGLEPAYRDIKNKLAN